MLLRPTGELKNCARCLWPARGRLQRQGWFPLPSTWIQTKFKVRRVCHGLANEKCAGGFQLLALGGRSETQGTRAVHLGLDLDNQAREINPI